MQQMELREALESATAAKDASRLDTLRAELTQSRRVLEEHIGEAIDAKQDYRGAAQLVRKLQFLDKLDSEIDSAYESVE